MTRTSPAKMERLEVKDPNGAPILFFEGAPNSGVYRDIVNVTLVATRRLLNVEAVDVDLIAVAHLRCSLQSARELRQALDHAILIAMDTPDQKN